MINYKKWHNFNNEKPKKEDIYLCRREIEKGIKSYFVAKYHEETKEFMDGGILVLNVDEWQEIQR